ncbi:MAG: hypothetical protein R6U46_06185 [Marinilabilia sp.]
MWILLISILVALAFAFLASKLSSGKGEESAEPQASIPADCCGAHEICEKENLMAQALGETIYYNDEELDHFSGKDPEQYTADETEQFREILETMQPREVSGWLTSLLKRRIKLPPAIREEAMTIARQHQQAAENLPL